MLQQVGTPFPDEKIGDTTRITQFPPFLIFGWMTFGELIETIYLRVTAGQPTSDSNIRPEDISTYIAPAINYAIVKDYYVNKQIDAGISEDFIATTQETVKYDSDRGVYYIELSNPVLSLGRNKGIRSVGSVAGDLDLVPTRPEARKHDSYVKGSLKKQYTFYLEGNKLIIPRLPSSVSTLLVRKIESIKNLNNDDEVPVPDQYLTEVIDIAMQFFTGQRKMPSDETPNENPNG